MPTGSSHSCLSRVLIAISAVLILAFFGAVISGSFAFLKLEYESRAFETPDIRKSTINIESGDIDVIDLPAMYRPRITTQTFDGVIYNYCLFLDTPDEFEITDKMVHEVERKLLEFIEDKLNSNSRIRRELSRYKRLYRGIVKENRRYMIINFIHEKTHHIQEGDWLRKFFYVIGGGDDYFTIWYELEADEFTELTINAPM